MLRRLILATLLSAALAVPASANASDRACGLITTAQLKQVLGGSNYAFLRDLPAKSSRRNASGALHSSCNGYTWSGAKPASRQAALAALHAGKASLFAIDTYEPDAKSPAKKGWIKKQFPELVKNADGLAVLPGLPGLARFHTRTFAPKTYGLGAKGFLTNPVPGVLAGAAMWSKASDASAVFVTIGAGAGKPVANELNQLGAALVGAFGMKS
jgi:hypothetical protein